MARKMCLRVRGDKEADVPAPEIELWLEYQSGMIVLHGTAVNSDGSLDDEGWALLEFYEDGTFARVGAVGAPFNTSADGQMTEVGER